MLPFPGASPHCRSLNLSQGLRWPLLHNLPANPTPSLGCPLQTFQIKFLFKACFKILLIFPLGENRSLHQQLARLSLLVASPASKTCHCHNNACGWNNAIALKIVYCWWKKNYFPNIDLIALNHDFFKDTVGVYIQIE